MATTTKNKTEGQIGQVLKFDSAGYNLAIITIEQEIIPGIYRLKESYEYLGLTVPFNGTLLKELLTTGTGPTRKRIEHMTKTDLRGVSSPVALKTAMQQVEKFFEPVEEALEELKDRMKTVNRSSPYRISESDFRVTEGRIEINTYGLETHFTQFIGSETQLTIYKQLQRLAEEHNRTIDILRTNGIRFPMYGLIGSGSFLCKIKSGLTWGDEVEINIDSLQAIKNL